MIGIENISRNIWERLSFLNNEQRRTDIDYDEYLSVEIICNTSGLFSKRKYGYISKKDYKNFLTGSLRGILEVLDSYENGKSIAVNTNLILSISIIG